MALTLTMATGSVGLMYVSVTYAVARVSGAHLNPAVTLVHYLRGDVDGTDLSAVFDDTSATVRNYSFSQYSRCPGDRQFPKKYDPTQFPDAKYDWCK